MNKGRLVLLCLLVISATAFAQNKIIGRVVDATTGESLPQANVFFTNTSIGTSTGIDGSFELSGFASGKYDFNVTFVGYAMYRQSYTFSGTEVVRLLVKLPQDAEQLKEIVVTPNEREREQNIKAFKKLFLGENKFAKQCVITNMDEIYLYRDIGEGVFTAHSSKPIIVENKALGYRIRYHLLLFEHFYNTGELRIYGIPQFEELKERKSSERATWEKNRADAYRGSLVHFMRALASDQLLEEHFYVSRIYELPNPQRPPPEIIEKQIDSLRTLRNKAESNRSLVFSLQIAQLNKQASLPVTIDSFAVETLRSHALLDKDTANRVGFLGRLAIRYGPDEKYRQPSYNGQSRSRMGKNSDVRFLAKFNIFENGYYDNLGSLFIDGYWLATERVSMMVPLDYTLSKR